MAIACAGASVMKRPLVNYLADLSGMGRYRMPIPIYDVFDCQISIIFFGETFAQTQDWLQEVNEYIATQDVVIDTTAITKDVPTKLTENIEEIAFSLDSLGILDHAALGLHKLPFSETEQMQIARKYPVSVLIDPIPLRDSYDKFNIRSLKSLTNSLGPDYQVCVGEPFNDRLGSIDYAIRTNIAKTMCIDILQLGTVTNTLDAIKIIQKSGAEVVYSSSSSSSFLDSSFVASLCLSQSVAAVHLKRENLIDLSKSLVDVEKSVNKRKPKTVEN
jgi:hypothetical protein